MIQNQNKSFIARKKAFLARGTVKVIFFGLNIAIKIIVFFIINPVNQGLIYNILCIGYIFYHKSLIKKFCWFDRFLFYNFNSLIFYSSNSLKHLFIWQNTLAFIMTHCCSNILIYTVFFFILTINTYLKRNLSLALIEQFL